VSYFLGRVHNSWVKSAIATPAHVTFQEALSVELVERGEFVNVRERTYLTACAARAAAEPSV
jgi:hypothetical protein